jgi:hypothetical protein
LFREFLVGLIPVTLYAHPMHGLAFAKSVLAHHCQIVLRVTGGGTRIATDAKIQIYHHGPFVFILVVPAFLGATAIFGPVT